MVSAQSLAAGAGAGLTPEDWDLWHFGTVLTMSGYLGDLALNALSACHGLTSGGAAGAHAGGASETSCYYLCGGNGHRLARHCYARWTAVGALVVIVGILDAGGVTSRSGGGSW